ncbi:WecB/TagA/CpsF family glycosyltransferase [Photobacterium damselae]
MYNSIDQKIKSNDKIKFILDDFLSNVNTSYRITFLNPFSYYRYIESGYNDYFSDLFIDGVFLEKLHNIIYRSNIKRASFDFSSIASDVFCFANIHKIPITMIGGNDIEIENTIKSLSQKYPNIDFSLCYNGYFDETKKLDIIQILMNKPGKRIIIFGLGTPLQEKMVKEFYNILFKCDYIYFTCGGFITQTAIRHDYYNPIIKKLGLRWLQRAIEFPHVRKRLLFDYPKFVYRYLRDHYVRKKN